MISEPHDHIMFYANCNTDVCIAETEIDAVESLLRKILRGNNITIYGIRRWTDRGNAVYFEDVYNSKFDFFVKRANKKIIENIEAIQRKEKINKKSHIRKVWMTNIDENFLNEWLLMPAVDIPEYKNLNYVILIKKSTTGLSRHIIKYIPDPTIYPKDGYSLIYPKAAYSHKEETLLL